MWSPYLLLTLLPLSISGLTVVDISSPTLWPANQDLVTSLRTDGVLVFKGLGSKYITALTSLREKAPNCLEEALKVQLGDGSNRFTTARDTLEEDEPFPSCVREETEAVTAAFDKVDEQLATILRQNFGQSIDVMEQEGGVVRKWEDLDSKTHLHVYRPTESPLSTKLALPYHTDNGLYVLLTPSSFLPLLSLSKDLHTKVLDTGDDSVLLLLGTGLTSWLLPSSGLHAPSHALPALSNSLTPGSRTVLARMKVAPALSLPYKSPSSPTFWSHFSAPLSTEKGSTLARLRKQRSAGCSQDWPHACSHGCDLPGVYLTWNNGEPIEQFNNVDAGECKARCQENPDCAGWTLNTNNGWCGLKKENQIKLEDNSGFTSGINDASSSYCSRQPRGKREAERNSLQGTCNV